MSLKHLLALAGLVAMAACQGPTENQPLCSWFDVDEDNYQCGTQDPIDQLFPVPAEHTEPGADEDA